MKEPDGEIRDTCADCRHFKYTKKGIMSAEGWCWSFSGFIESYGLACKKFEAKSQTNANREEA